MVFEKYCTFFRWRRGGAGSKVEKAHPMGWRGAWCSKTILDEMMCGEQGEGGTEKTTVAKENGVERERVLQNVWQYLLMCGEQEAGGLKDCYNNPMGGEGAGVQRSTYYAPWCLGRGCSIPKKRGPWGGFVLGKQDMLPRVNGVDRRLVVEASRKKFYGARGTGSEKKDHLDPMGGSVLGVEKTAHRSPWCGVRGLER